MKLATTTGDFKGYVKTTAESVKCIAEAGFRCVDVSFYDKSFIYAEDWREQVADIKRIAEACGVDLIQAHAANFDPYHPQADFDRECDGLQRTLEATAMLGIRNIVLHPMLVPHNYELYPNGKEAFFQYNKNLYDLVLPEAARRGIHILIENSAEKNMDGRYFLMTGQDMVDFIDYVGHPYLKAVWDIGHANMRANNQYEDIITLGDHLAGLHIQDNDGVCDEHTAPFSGTVNMDAIMQGLLKIDYKGYFTFESDNYLLKAGSWPYTRKSFAGDMPNRLSDPSLALRMMAEKQLYAIGRFILEQYDVFEG